MIAGRVPPPFAVVWKGLHELEAPPELFIEAAFVVSLIDLIRKPVPERYRRNPAVFAENPRPSLWPSLRKSR